VDAGAYLGWLLWQWAIGGWGVLGLIVSAGLALFAISKRRAAAWALVMVVMPILPPVLATIGWATSARADRTAEWVVGATLGCLVLWGVAAFASFILAAGVRWAIALCIVLSAAPMLIGALLGAMSGSGDLL
jgi:hypothetical protein